jgi:hypothetical protein
MKGDGLDGGHGRNGAAGRGSSGRSRDEAVIFVEIAYDYESLVGETFGFSDEVHATASFTVRDDRDLTQIYQRNPGNPDPVASCNVYEDESSLAA